MKRLHVTFLFLWFSQLLLCAAASAEEPPRVVMPKHHLLFFKKYCLDCHDAATEEGKVNLETISFDLGHDRVGGEVAKDSEYAQFG